VTERASRIIVALTGASGAIYGVRMLRYAADSFDEVYAMVSKPATDVLRHEMGIAVDPRAPTVEAIIGAPRTNVTLLDPDDFFAPVASGSFRHDGMVIAPCSVGTAGRIANGISSDLISRAADVALKEKRPLVLVVRETPLSLIHLHNLVRLAEAGATILPASPSFYSHPSSIDDLVDTVVHRALQCLGCTVPDAHEWGMD
jgi:4-hydroxy-3-polyprenylbenzoate decarboxylase